MPEPERILAVRDVTRHFPVRGERLFERRVVHALDGVSFDLGAGETLGIVGESGSGKSTLARLIVGLDHPTRGQILYQGRDVHAADRRQRRDLRRRIQIVLQDPYSSLNPRRTLRETLLQPFVVNPGVLPAEKRLARVKELTELVGLDPDHLDRLPAQFSGGQRQRISIARALTLRPEVIVCDEAVSALDVSIQAQIVNLFKRLQRELGLSYVFISHDLAVVQHISTRVAVMYLGKLMEIGPRGSTYAEPRHPYTGALLSAVPRLEGPGQRQLLRGDPPSPLDPPPGCRFHTRCPRAAERCATVEPSLDPVAEVPRHAVACHYPLP